MTIKVGDAILLLGADSKKLKGDLARARGEAQQQVSGLGQMLQQSLAFAIGGAILSGFQKLTSLIGNLGKEMLMTAARAQEMSLVAQAVGANAGIAADAVNEEIQAIKDLGITTEVAATTVTRFIQNQLDLTKAVELAAVAQNAAVIAGEDSSATLEGLIYGITSMNSRVLRTRGILFDSQQALESYAAAIGKTADELTIAEQQAAFLNATIEAGIPIMGLYDVAMRTFSKQLRSIPRDFKEISEAIMKPFLPAATTVLETFRGILKVIRDACSEGGVLYPILMKLGAALSIVADVMKGVGVEGAKAGVNFIAKFANKMLEAAENALRWGVNIATNLANGLIKGAVQAITAALNFISGLLRSWMAPGSPPRIARGIVQWGAETIAEWLRGFTQADFSILDSVQYALRQALDVREALGEIGQGEAARLYAGLSEDLIEALSGAGPVSEEVLERIRQEAGAYGEEIVRLIELQQELTATTDALREAEEHRDAARETLEGVREEYEQLLRLGAPTDVLEAKQREFELAQQNYDAAEDQVDAEEERRQQLEEQIRLQEQLVQQLLQAAQAQADLLRPPTGGAGGVGPIEDLEEALDGVSEAAHEAEEAIAALPPPINLDEVFEEAKQTLWERILEIFAPLIDAVAGLQEEFGPLGEAVSTFGWTVYDFLSPEGPGGKFLGWFGFEMPEAGDTLGESIVKLLGPLGVFGRFLINTLLPKCQELNMWLIEKIGAGMDELAKWWDETGKGQWEEVKTKLEDVRKEVADWLAPKLEWFRTEVLEPLKPAWDKISEAIQGVIDWIKKFIEELGKVLIPDWLRGGSPPPLANWLSEIGSAMEDMALEVTPELSAALQDVPAPTAAGYADQRTYSRTVHYHIPEGRGMTPDQLKEMQRQDARRSLITRGG